MKQRIASHMFVSNEYCRLCKSVLNNTKSPVPQSIWSSRIYSRSCCVIYSKVHFQLKTWHIWNNYAPSRIETLVSDMRIHPSLISEVIFKLDAHNWNGCDGISVIPKKYVPERTPFLSIFYKNCFATSTFQFVEIPLLQFLFLRILKNIISPNYSLNVLRKGIQGFNQCRSG